MRRVVRSACLVVAGLLAGGPPRAQAAPTPADWTVLLYWNGDCNLEAAVLTELESVLAVRAQAAPGPERVHLLAFVDRSTNDEPPDHTGRAVGGQAGWTDARLFHLASSGPSAPRTLVLVPGWTPQELDMDEAATLSEALHAAHESFPATRYAVLLKGHGLGWQGYGFDTDPPGDALHLPEATKALSDFTCETGRRVDLVGYDSCLMGCAEVAQALAPHARWCLASEGISDTFSWSYETVLEELVASPSMDAGALSARFAQTYRDPTGTTCRRTLDGGMLAQVDLGAADALAAATSTLGVKLAAWLRPSATAFVSSFSPRYRLVARARLHAAYFDWSSQAAWCSVRDLRQFAVRLARELRAFAFPPNAAALDVATAADLVAAAVDGQAVRCLATEPEYAGTGGLSIWFPPACSTDFPGFYAKHDGLETTIPGWSAFLRTWSAVGCPPQPVPLLVEFRAVERPTLLERAPRPGEVPFLREQGRVELTAKVEDPDALAQVLFTVDASAARDDRIRLGGLPPPAVADGRLAIEWDGTWPTIEGEGGHVFAPITCVSAAPADDPGPYVADVLVGHRPARDLGPFRPTILRYALRREGTGWRGDLRVAFEPGGKGRPPHPVTLHPGDELIPLYEWAGGGAPRPSAAAGFDHVTVARDGKVPLASRRLPPGVAHAGFVATGFGREPAVRVDSAVLLVR